MAARRLANACIILMALACGLMGIDVNEKEPLCPIAGAGVVFHGRPGRERFARLFCYTSMTAGPGAIDPLHWQCVP